jgi:thymidylate kinase
MHIAIEGLDGVGKTSTAKLLADEIGFKFIEKPMHYLTDVDGINNYI